MFRGAEKEILNKRSLESSVHYRLTKMRNTRNVSAANPAVNIEKLRLMELTLK